MIRLDNIPRYPGFNHFKSLIGSGEFADGGKLEDLSKVSRPDSSCFEHVV